MIIWIELGEGPPLNAKSVGVKKGWNLTVSWRWVHYPVSVFWACPCEIQLATIFTLLLLLGRPECDLMDTWKNIRNSTCSACSRVGQTRFKGMSQGGRNKPLISHMKGSYFIYLLTDVPKVFYKVLFSFLECNTQGFMVGRSEIFHLMLFILFPYLTSP